MIHPANISDMLIMQFNEIIAEHTGLFFPRDRLLDLKRCVTNAALESGARDVNSFIHRYMDGPMTRQQIEILASHLTVGETYFFREPESFEAIKRHIFTDLVQSRRGRDQYLRIWVAGCATGEEAYTMAIVLEELIPDIDNWRIIILATDINPLFLQKAGNGLYSEWSFRRVPLWIRKKYFNSTNEGSFRVNPRIKRMVNFSYHNLAEDNYPELSNGTNAMDLIICRNVLMYFKPVLITRVIRNLRRCLVNGGWLAVSPVETSNTLFPEFTSTNLDGATFYRRMDEPAKNNSRDNFTVGPYTENPHHPDEPQSQFTEALAIPNENIVSAIETLQDAKTVVAVIDPYDRAYSSYMAGQYEQAQAEITHLLFEKPKEIRAFKLLARILANQGRLHEAMDWCVKAIGVDMLDAGSQYLLATIQHELGLLEDTVKSLKRALYLDPELILAYFTLGNLARTQGKKGEQNKYFMNVLALLNQYRPEDTLPESDGMTAMRLREIIHSLALPQEAA